MARTANGNYSKTFQGLNLVDSNTADLTRQMVIQNLTSNDTYRSAVGIFNPGLNSLTVELSLRDSSNTILGSAFTRTMGAYDFQAFNPFTQAGVPYPGNSYSNTHILINPTSGSGLVFCFGATTNNVTNDPAAHVAVQESTGYINSPQNYQVIPEVIWAPASGGGTWMSEVQITDFSGGSAVSVYFTPYGAGRRGPFSLWTGPGEKNSVKYDNILETVSGLDSGYDYYGKVGSIEFVTQDSAHVINATARTYNGNYSKTFQGLNYLDANTADTTRQMIIQNMPSNDIYRSATGVFNVTGNSVTVEFSLIDSTGSSIGSTFTRTIAGYEFQSFNPFTQAGVPYPANSYDNIWIYINPISGTGEIMCFGATSNNTSNDPAAHSAVQYE
jgi:hypothetical protein